MSNLNGPSWAPYVYRINVVAQCLDWTWFAICLLTDDDDVLMSGDGSGSMFDDPIINEELDVQLPDVDNRCVV